jgi:hypothetical protein
VKYSGSGAGDGYALSGAGMQEGQRTGMQALGGQAELRRVVAVDGIAEDGVTAKREVDADLMRASGFKAAAQMRIAAVAGDDLKMRYSRPAVFFGHGHALAVRRIASDGGGNGGRNPLADIAADDTLIGAGRVCGP